MPIAQNGALPLRRSNNPPNRPMVLGDADSRELIPLPPPEALHGVNLPGGNSHAPASATQAGFMTPEQVQQIEGLGASLAKLMGMVAPKEHSHPQQPPLPHEHPDLGLSISKVSELVQKLQSFTLQGFDARPVVDTEAFALKGHEHPPHPMPKHEHPHEHAPVGPTPGFMTPSHVKMLDKCNLELQEAFQKLKQLQDGYSHVRKILDDHPAPAPARLDHGHLPGGRLHAAVSDRQAGFMTPEQMRKLDKLWELATAQPTPNKSE